MVKDSPCGRMRAPGNLTSHSLLGARWCFFQELGYRWTDIVGKMMGLKSSDFAEGMTEEEEMDSDIMRGWN